MSSISSRSASSTSPPPPKPDNPDKSDVNGEDIRLRKRGCGDGDSPESWGSAVVLAALARSFNALAATSAVVTSSVIGGGGGVDGNGSDDSVSSVGGSSEGALELPDFRATFFLVTTVGSILNFTTIAKVCMMLRLLKLSTTALVLYVSSVTV